MVSKKNNSISISSEKNHSVVFTPSGLRGIVKSGVSVLDAARQLRVDLDSVCGGRGICTKCKVKPSFGNFSKFNITAEENNLSNFTEIEKKSKEKNRIYFNERLGCQAKIIGDVIIDIPEESQVHKQVIRKRIELKDIDIHPTTKLYYVEVEEPDIHNPSGDLQRLNDSLNKQWGISNTKTCLKVLKNLQYNLRKGKWSVTCAIFKETNEIINIWPGFLDSNLYGIAVDLGSTTIAAHICNLSTGEIVNSSGIMNPQIRFGEDLMSRVSFSMMNEDGTEKLKDAVQETLNQLCKTLIKDSKIDHKLVVELSIVCNPVMHHLLLGINPIELGQAPFALATSNSLYFKSEELALNCLQNATIFILPCIAGHVGADAAAVVLSEAPNESKETVLIIDVGTNAELILGNKYELYACSSPTGPAFEGAQISSGQRAAPGAIEKVKIDPITKDPIFKVIGSDYWSDEIEFKNFVKNQPITGICGSGIIEAIAEMRINGILDKSGLIGSSIETGSKRSITDGRTYSYLLYEDKNNGENKIKITNADVRAIQLAKAALFAGSRLLMDEMKIKKVDKIVLAGAFGAHISTKHAMVLGMIPDCNLKNVISAGNAAGAGAIIALLNKNSRSKISKIVKKINKIETAMAPKFQEYFVSASGIPNSMFSFPELDKVVKLPEVNFNKKKRVRK